MQKGDIVYLPYKGNYVRYKIRKVFDDSLLLTTFKTDIINWVPISDILTTEEFTKIYKNEIIYE